MRAVMRPVGTSVAAFEMLPTCASSAMVMVSAHSPVPPEAPPEPAGVDAPALSEVPEPPHAASTSAPTKRNARAFHLVRLINSLQWVGMGNGLRAHDGRTPSGARPDRP